jgi:hypothetical protein
MTIKKHFSTQRQAERYLERLYGMYNYVRLIGFPPFYESGTYTFTIIP